MACFYKISEKGYKMKVNVIFPNKVAYESKDINTQRDFRNTFKEWLEFLVGTKADIYTIYEDEFAHDMLNELNILHKAVSIMDASDKKFIEFKNADLHIVEDYFLDETPDEVVTPYIRKIDIPNVATYKDKSKWVEDRLEVARQRLKLSCQWYVNNCDVIVMFMCNRQNYVKSPKLKSYLGDGKLIVEVHLDTKMIDIVYGGVSIDKETLKTILELQE